MTSPSARARSAIASSIPSHLTWLCSNDFIQPCVAFLGPTDLIETMEQYSTSSFNVLRGGYDLTLPERGNGSDDEDEDADVIAASQAPPGIIYLTWFMNRIMYVPALRVLLFRWDGIHDNFASVRKLINDQVKTFRQCNRTRSGSLTVVIFKTSSPLEDEVLLERQMMTLRDDLGLTEDFILLSQSYRLAESMERIVSQIKENAIVSYNNCIKTLKRKRSKLGRNSHIFYLIRYHIKLGFYSFLSQDVNAAKKSFNAALKDLTELQSLSTFELIEVRDVGLIVNAMICRLLILSEDLSGAMEQFDRHIRLMSKMISEDHFAKLLRFMQFSWLQQEYLIMSFLTQASVAHCLRYVNSAANALTRRMECSFSIPDFEKHYAYQLNELMQKSPFYCGQIQRYDEEECDNTLAADLCMLAESQYRQSANATSLLTVSHNLLLAYPRKRKRQIALSELRIAKHLYSTCNYTAALPLFEKAVNIFRKERWTDMLISTLHCVRHTCVSLGLVPESILYTCELIALVQDVSTIQKELMLYLSKFHECIDVSSTGIIALRQGPGNFSISSKFDPEVKLESIVVFDEIGNSSELCREIAISRGIPLTYQVELPIQSYAVLTMKTGAMRISVEQQHQRRCRKVGSVRVTTNLDNPTIFLQEMFPLSMKLFNAEEYGFYTFYGSQPDIVLDDDSCEPIVFGDSITFPQTKSSSGSGKVVKAQLQFQSSGSFWVSLRLLGDKIPYFEHELALRVVKPLEIIENFSSLSCTNLETSISGRFVLRLGYPSALHLHLRNASDISIHVIEVFFDYDSSFIEMKQLSSHVVGRDLSPGDCISLHFAFIPVKPCSSTIPGQIRFNWKRADASCIQTFGMPLSQPISIIAPSLYANVLIPPSEAIEIGKPCQMMVKIHSQLQVASRIRVITQAPKSVYHIVGPLKSTVLVPAQDCLILKWKLFPLQPGFQTLPSVQITNDEGESLLSDKPLAGIFVTPCMISESIS